MRKLSTYRRGIELDNGRETILITYNSVIDGKVR